MNEPGGIGSDLADAHARIQALEDQVSVDTSIIKALRADLDQTIQCPHHWIYWDHRRQRTCKLCGKKTAGEEQCSICGDPSNCVIPDCPVKSADSRQAGCICEYDDVLISQGCPVHDPSACGEGQEVPADYMTPEQLCADIWGEDWRNDPSYLRARAFILETAEQAQP